MEKWEISFVWRPPHSLPGMALWEVRETKHWVTLDGGSRWFQTVERELCRKGPMRSVHPQLGDQGFPLTRPELCFLRGRKPGWTAGGHGWVNLQKWRLVKLCCPDTFNHIWNRREAHYILKKHIQKKKYWHTCSQSTKLPTLMPQMCKYFSARLNVFSLACDLQFTGVGS